MSQQTLSFSEHVTRDWRAPEAWRLPELPELTGLVGFDFETKDPGIGAGRGSSWAIPSEGFVTGAAISWEGGEFYCPVEHAAGNMDPGLFWRWVKAQAAKPDVTFVAANSIYESGWLGRYGIEPVNAPYDVQIEAALLDEHLNSYSLDALVRREFPGEMKSQAAFIERCRELRIANVMSNMEKVPAWLVAPYAIDDARFARRLHLHYMPKIEAEGLVEVNELERQCALVARDMRRLGVRVDLREADIARSDFKIKRDEALADIKHRTGVAMSPMEAEGAARALTIENGDVSLTKTSQGRTSITTEILASLNTPVAKAIRLARKYDKAVSTFFDNYLFKYAIGDRIYAEFHPTRRNREDSDSVQGTTSGRFSCVAGWTPVETPLGPVRIDALKVGDLVRTHRGRFRPVLATYIKGVEKMIQINLSNGQVLTCTKKHRLLLSCGNWITAGELRGYIGKMDIKFREHIECSCAVSQSVAPNDQTDCGTSEYDISECGFDHHDPHSPLRAKGPSVAALLSVEGGCEKSHDGKIHGRAPRLSGGVPRWEGPGNDVIEWPANSGGSCRCSKSLGHEISAPLSGGASHRQQSNEQRLGQFGTGYDKGTQNYPRLAAPGADYIEITSIEDVGRFEVFDITVADDESYEAVGCFSHNSSNPNLQNIPNRDPDIGPFIRRCFIPEDGEVWLKLDYASQEPRLLIHFAYLARKRGQHLRGVVEMVARFRRDPMTDLHGECAALMNVPRGRAKTINLAIAYGAQGGNIAHQLGLPTKWITTKSGREIEVAGPEAQALLDLHLDAVPFVKQLQDMAKAQVEDAGYVKTIMKRRIRFQKYDGINYARTHKGLNGVIQGSAGDQMKVALVALRRAGIPMNLTVHDEGDRSHPQGAEGDRLRRHIMDIMENAILISVPMVAEAEAGPNWGSLQKVARDA